MSIKNQASRRQGMLPVSCWWLWVRSRWTVITVSLGLKQGFPHVSSKWQGFKRSGGLKVYFYSFCEKIKGTVTCPTEVWVLQHRWPRFSSLSCWHPGTTKPGLMLGILYTESTSFFFLFFVFGCSSLKYRLSLIFFSLFRTVLRTFSAIKLVFLAGVSTDGEWQLLSACLSATLIMHRWENITTRKKQVESLVDWYDEWKIISLSPRRWLFFLFL